MRARSTTRSASCCRAGAHAARTAAPHRSSSTPPPARLPSRRPPRSRSRVLLTCHHHTMFLLLISRCCLVQPPMRSLGASRVAFAREVGAVGELACDLRVAPAVWMCTGSCLSRGLRPVFCRAAECGGDVRWRGPGCKAPVHASFCTLQVCRAALVCLIRKQQGGMCCPCGAYEARK